VEKVRLGGPPLIDPQAPHLHVAEALPFEVFFATEYRAVAALTAVLSGSTAAGEDLAQEAFVAALARWEQVGTY
jgi:DNA-directed RNA polymerase specialized sigma24 family protein